jgi:predicted  nucleic acid-binding Zn-ribbon protein
MEIFEQQQVVVLRECPDCGWTFHDRGPDENPHICSSDADDGRLLLATAIAAHPAIVERPNLLLENTVPIVHEISRVAHSEGYHKALDAVLDFASRHSFKETIAQVKLWNTNK